VTIERGKEIIRLEAEAILAQIDHVDEEFKKAVDLLLKCKGRVIVTGMGKSGIIAQKIAGTLTSTGTAALFLHPADGVHGDLGAVQGDDVVICISKSGNTDEIMRLMPVFRTIGVPVIAMTGNTTSPMALKSDVILNVGVREEACPYDLVPTSSTTATLVMGDALALSIFQERGFTVEQFARYHPGGNIGRRITLKINDIMRSGEDIATVPLTAMLSDIILEITSKRLGAATVIDRAGRVKGIVTDGDLRRLMESRQDIWDLSAESLMTRNPKTVLSGSLAVHALEVMEEFSINQLIIVNKKGRPEGMVHLHDLLKAGLAD
jgi:arabinose-5-phosphate isomerase